LKFTSSAFSSVEQENFDILGEYWISDLDSKGNATISDSLSNLAVGAF
jgi:hypothetical protein